MDKIFESLKKLAFNYAKLTLVQSGVPLVLNQVEDFKINAEKKAQSIIVKAILVSIALLFLLVSFAFIFVSVYFAFLGNNNAQMLASIYTAGVGLLFAIILFLIAAAWK